jgi:DNA-binding LytR/AlgR family response regulator
MTTQVYNLNRVSFPILAGYAMFHPKDIIYIQANGRSSLLTTKFDRTPIKVYYSITDMENMLHDIDIFFRCHRSYIVNIGFVIYFNSNRLTLHPFNNYIPLARNRNKHFMQSVLMTNKSPKLYEK